MKLSACLAVVVVMLSACGPVDSAGLDAEKADAAAPDDATDATADTTPTVCEQYAPVDGVPYVHCGATACALLDRDPSNCGACGNVCPESSTPPWQRCVASVCR